MLGRLVLVKPREIFGSMKVITQMDISMVRDDLFVKTVNFMKVVYIIILKKVKVY
jgi:hypothetical protein